MAAKAFHHHKLGNLLLPSLTAISKAKKMSGRNLWAKVAPV